MASSLPAWLDALLRELQAPSTEGTPPAAGVQERLDLETLLRRRPELGRRKQKRALALSVLAVLGHSRSRRERLLPVVERYAKLDLQAAGGGSRGGVGGLAAWQAGALGTGAVIYLLERPPPVPPPKPVTGKMEGAPTIEPTDGLPVITDAWLELRTATSTVVIDTKEGVAPPLEAADLLALGFGALCLLYAGYLAWLLCRPPSAKLVEARRAHKKEVEKGQLAVANQDERDHPHRGSPRVSRHPPEPGPLGDALAALGGMGAPEVSRRLDGERTVAEVIERGGMWCPVWETVPHPEPLIVLLDGERQGTSVWLPRFRAWLKALVDHGVSVEVYRFDEHPSDLQREDPRTGEARRWVTLAEVARSPAGPLLVFSRQLRAFDREGPSAWVSDLCRFGRKAWVNPNPYAPAAGTNHRGLAKAGFRMFAATDVALARCAEYLAGAQPALLTLRLPDRRDPIVVRALERWAGACALVPDPDWDLVEDLRRQPGIQEALDRPEHVALLLAHLEAADEAGDGRGPNLFIEAYRPWVQTLRTEDPELERASRRLLLRSLEREALTNMLVRARVELRRARHLALLEPSPERVARLREIFEADPLVRSEARVELEDVFYYFEQDADPAVRRLVEDAGEGTPAEERPPERVPARRWLPMGDGRWASTFMALMLVALTLLGAGAALAALEPFRAFWLGRPLEERAQVRPGTETVRERDLESLPATDFRPAMIPIPKGLFGMGEPPWPVLVEQPYWMGRTEVTRAQWAALMEGLPEKSAEGEGEDRPIETITWFSALAFANVLSDQEGLERCYTLDRCTGAAREGDLECESLVTRPPSQCLGYRLPTEAEWERAALGGQDGPREPPTVTDVQELAWFVENSREETHAVATKKANPFGLFDTLGNVWEWTSSPYAATILERFEASPDPDAHAPRDVVPGDVVYRGCGWNNFARGCRAAMRSAYRPGGRDAGLGFRPARSVPGPSIPLPSTRAQPSRLAKTALRPALLPIPRGTFLMGSPPDEEGRYQNEPRHPVTIERDYWMGRTEVTRAQWRAAMGRLPEDSAPGEGDERPIESVTWFSALAFANRISEAEGLPLCFTLERCTGEAALGTLECSTLRAVAPSACPGYRLPTEAEWERAARAGEDGPLYVPGAALEDLAWDASNSAGTHAVGEKAANAFGLHDVLGNVWEWTLSPDDGLEEATEPEPDQDAARPFAAIGEVVVARGCGWSDSARNCRAASRYAYRPGVRGASLGFRLARSGPRSSNP